MQLSGWCRTFHLVQVKGQILHNTYIYGWSCQCWHWSYLHEKRPLEWRSAGRGSKLTVTAGKNMVKWNSIPAAVDLPGFKLLRQGVIFKQNFNLHIHELFLVTCSKIAVWAWLAMCSHRAGAWPGSLPMPGNAKCPAHTWTKYPSLSVYIYIYAYK